MRGLEVTFTQPLEKFLSGVSPRECSALFFFEILQNYDPQRKTVILRADYEALMTLGKNQIVFQSAAPNAPPIWVDKSSIESIKELAEDKVLYPET